MNKIYPLVLALLIGAAAMAADRALPPQLAVHSARGVPSAAVLTQGVLGIAFVMVGDLARLIRFVGFTLAVFAALTVGALFILRRRGMRGPYRTLGYPVTPLVFIAVSVWIAYAQISSHPTESGIVGLVFVAGALVYVFGVKGPPNPPQKLPEARSVDE